VDNYGGNPVRTRAHNSGDNQVDQFRPQLTTDCPPFVPVTYTQLYVSCQQAKSLLYMAFSRLSTESAFPYYYHCY